MRKFLLFIGSVINLLVTTDHRPLLISIVAPNDRIRLSVAKYMRNLLAQKGAVVYFVPDDFETGYPRFTSPDGVKGFINGHVYITTTAGAVSSFVKEQNATKMMLEVPSVFKIWAAIRSLFSRNLHIPVSTLVEAGIVAHTDAK